MKKVISAVLSTALTFVFLTSHTMPASAITATPTASAVLVNGIDAAFDAYNIEGDNYFRLRDLAFTLSGTEKQFEVRWNGESNAIELTSGMPYTPDGSEMADRSAGEKAPIPTSTRVLLDGTEVQFTAYNIEGNNYFRLRDIGEAFDFSVVWDGDRNTIIIDTTKAYTPEDGNAAVPPPTPQTKMYDEFPSVPDFGAFAGVTTYRRHVLNSYTVGYLYKCTFRPEAVDEYTDLLIENSFVYERWFTFEGETQLVYRKDSLSVTIGLLGYYFVVMPSYGQQVS